LGPGIPGSLEKSAGSLLNNKAWFNLCLLCRKSPHFSPDFLNGLYRCNDQPAFYSWTFAAAFVTLAALIITAHVLAYPSRKGITTEIAAFLFGGLVWCQMTPLAAALSFVTVLPDRTFGPLEVLNPYKYGELCL